MKKLLALALVGVMSLSLLVGCGGKEEGNGGDAPAGPEQIKLTVWCPQNQVETGIMEQQMKEFAEANADKWTIEWDINVVGEDVVVALGGLSLQFGADVGLVFIQSVVISVIDNSHKMPNKNFSKNFINLNKIHN